MPAKREAVAHHRFVGDQAAFRISGGSRCVKHQADVAHAHSDACNVYLQIRDVLARRFEVRFVNETRRLGLAKQHDIAQFWRGRKLQASGVATARQPGSALRSRSTKFTESAIESVVTTVTMSPFSIT